MPGRPRTDAPRTNREPAEVERKLSLLHQPHIAPLTTFVDRLRDLKPEAAIPYFDPTEAGAAAPILLLLEAPERRSALERGSGFVSSDNNDQTAENMWLLLREAGVDRARDVATWNVVPWYIGDETKIRPTRSSDLDEAREAKTQLLGMLPNLRVAVLLGRPAAKAWGRLGLDIDAIGGPAPLAAEPQHPPRAARGGPSGAPSRLRKDDAWAARRLGTGDPRSQMRKRPAMVPAAPNGVRPSASGRWWQVSPIACRCGASRVAVIPFIGSSAWPMKN